MNVGGTDQPAAPDAPAGWVRLGDRKWWTTWAGVGTGFAVVAVVWGAAQFGRFFEDVVPWPSTLVLGALTMLGVLGLVTLLRNARYPQPWVHLGTDELRAGRRTVALGDVRRAVVPQDPVQRSGVLVLRLVADQLRVEIVLRDRRGPCLDAATTAVLVEALGRTSVAMPTSPDDPTGRFGRINFPGHVDLDAAVALVEHPPGPGEPLPASW